MSNALHIEYNNSNDRPTEKKTILLPRCTSFYALYCVYLFSCECSDQSVLTAMIFDNSELFEEGKGTVTPE